MSDKFGTTLDLSGNPAAAPAATPAPATQRATPPADPVFGRPTGDCLGRLAHYRVLKLLGRGGMGGVYLAHDETLDRRVALKILLPEAAVEPGARSRFIREARAAAAVKHDHVVTIYQVGQDRGIPFIAMEFLTGYPLDRYLARKGRLTVAQSLRVGLETAEGLAAAHELGLVHRDIKPGNLWLEAPRGRIKILDFGIARRVSEDPRAGLTGTGAVLGTPGYMSPEQARGKGLDHRSDLFSLGVVLYELTTGRPPFCGDSTMAVLTALAVDTPVLPRSLNSDIPPAFEAVINRLLQKDPDARPASAADVAAELRAIAEPAGVPLASSAEHTPVPGSLPAPILVTAVEPDASAFEGMADTGTQAATERPRTQRVNPGAGWGVWAAAGVALVLAVVMMAGTGYALRKQAAPPADEHPPEPKPVAAAKAAPKPAAQAPAPQNITPTVQAPAVPDYGPNGVNPEFSEALDRFLAGEGLKERELAILRDTPGRLILHVGPTALDDARFEQMTKCRWAADTLEFGAVVPKLTDAGLAHAARMRALRVLVLDQTQATDAGLKPLAELSRLNVLGLRGARLTDEAGPALVALPGLTSLDLSDTGVGDETLKHIAGLSRLRELNLRGTKVTDVGLARLHGRSLPLVVDVTGTRVGKAAAKRLSDALPAGSVVGVGSDAP